MLDVTTFNILFLSFTGNGEMSYNFWEDKVCVNLTFLIARFNHIFSTLDKIKNSNLDSPWPRSDI